MSNLHLAQVDAQALLDNEINAEAYRRLRRAGEGPIDAIEMAGDIVSQLTKQEITTLDKTTAIDLGWQRYTRNSEEALPA